MLSRSETFCSAGKTTIGAVPRQYNEISVVEINHDIYSKHTFTVKVCNYKKNKDNGQSQQFPKINCTSKEVFLSKGLEAAEEIQQSNSKTYERCRNSASMKDLDAKFRMAFSPRNSQLTLHRPPQGVFIMMVPTGRLRPKEASSYGGQAGSQSGHLRSLTAKFKFQLMAKQINNFERA